VVVLYFVFRKKDDGEGQEGEGEEVESQEGGTSWRTRTKLKFPSYY